MVVRTRRASEGPPQTRTTGWLAGCLRLGPARYTHVHSMVSLYYSLVLVCFIIYFLHGAFFEDLVIGGYKKKHTKLTKKKKRIYYLFYTGR